MRDYAKIDGYLDKLLEDVYPQPQDPGHTAWAAESIQSFMREVSGVNSVLDVGCGEAFCQDFFELHGVYYMGVCLGEDYEVALYQKARRVLKRDFSFLDFDDGAFDMLYARHSLEHSPMPLLTLMEWHRVTNNYLALVLPAPEHWRYVGKNHYYVLLVEQWENLFDVAGFNIVYEHLKKQRMSTDKTDPEVEIEFWYLLKKK